MLKGRKKQLELFSLQRRAERAAERRAMGTGAAARWLPASPAAPERAAAATQSGVHLRYLPHVAREEHDSRHPVHVTMRRVEVGPSFRQQRVCTAIRQVIERSKRNGVRVVHYSVQTNHIHLMVEGKNSADLSNQMRTLFSRIAFAVNAVARRSGKLFRDRHHRHALKTPREVRNALVYILFNDRKHHHAKVATLDPCSSAWWFDDWSPQDRPPKEQPEEPLGFEQPTVRPRTWLARWGWHRGVASRLIRFSEVPRGLDAER